MDMIRDTMRLIGSAPPQQEIKCGDLDEFVAAVKRQTGKDVIKASREFATFNGIEVKVSPHVPIDKAIVLENGQVKSIIDLRALSPKEPTDG
tara:strand:- start:448 stop:723 length:276 start_codon:yes stop_codon:yes gene_type:complete